MSFDILTAEMSDEESASFDAAIAGLGGLDADASELGWEELARRAAALVRLRSHIEGMYLAAVGEMTSRRGSQATAQVLRDHTRMSSAQARTESRLAETLNAEGFSETVDAMRQGAIQMSHARVIAREAPKKHRRSEADFIELSRMHRSDEIARHPLAYESKQVFADLAEEAAAAHADPIDAEHAMQRHRRHLSLRAGDDGMWSLRGQLDGLTGRQINITLQAAVRSLRRNNSSASSEDSLADDDAPSAGQLRADALCNLLLGKNRSRPPTSLVIVADYDLTSGRVANPRLDDGTPVSAKQLAELAADADVLPAMFKSDWSELALGRVRSASDAQRIVLAVRDGGCIGCALVSEHTEAHHIRYYEHNGNTDLPNLASLCRTCHTQVHQHHRNINTPADGRPRLQPPNRGDASSVPGGPPNADKSAAAPRNTGPPGDTDTQDAAAPSAKRPNAPPSRPPPNTAAA